MYSMEINFLFEISKCMSERGVTVDPHGWMCILWGIGMLIDVDQ